jgi:hypothetical protein
MLQGGVSCNNQGNQFCDDGNKVSGKHSSNQASFSHNVSKQVWLVYCIINIPAATLLLRSVMYVA